MIELVISGGQTGSDQSGWRAAKLTNWKTSGWMPKRFRTEGPKGVGSEFHPEFAKLYGAREHNSFEYGPRTFENVKWADITIYVRRNRKDSAGFWKTQGSALQLHKPFWDLAEPQFRVSPGKLFRMFYLFDYKIVNIAGTRESSDPGIGAWAESYLIEFFSYVNNSKVDQS